MSLPETLKTKGRICFSWLTNQLSNRIPEAGPDAAQQKPEINGGPSILNQDFP